MIKQAAGLDFPIGELVHCFEEFGCRGPGVGGFDYKHETHLRTLPKGEHRRRYKLLNCLDDEVDERARSGSTVTYEKYTSPARAIDG
jgi:hypothetical protein